jgi:hypothetical protein
VAVAALEVVVVVVVRASTIVEVGLKVGISIMMGERRGEVLVCVWDWDRRGCGRKVYPWL